MSPPFRQACAPIHHLTRHTLYRAYLRNLRCLPDPYAWAVLQPYLRNLLAIPPPPRQHEPALLDRAGGSAAADVQHAESSLQAQQRLDGQSDEQTEMKRIRQLRRARSELYHLRAAVACQAHALSRLLEVVYGVRGRQKWRALHSVSKAYPESQPSASTPHPPLPPPLLPLIGPPPPKSSTPPSERLRPIPAVALRTAPRRRAIHVRQTCPVPLILPMKGTRSASADGLETQGHNREMAHGGAKTGSEGKGVVESLRMLAGLDRPNASTVAESDARVYQALISPRNLPTYKLLPPHIQRLVPRSSPFTLPSPSLHQSSPTVHVDLDITRLPTGMRTGLPAAGEHRPNPRLWAPPSRFSPRILRRAYERLWDKLVWVRPVHRGVAANSGDGGAKEGEKEEWVKCTYEQAFPDEGSCGSGHGVGGYGEGSEDDARWLAGYLAQPDKAEAGKGQSKGVKRIEKRS